MFLFFDTETTGIPDWHTPSDDPRQPHIIELGAVLTDKDLNPVNEVSLIVRPDGWTISDEIAQMTGISQDYAERFGVSEELAVDALLELWRGGGGRVRVAHNEPFDARIVRIALKRARVDDDMLEAWKEAPRFCTQAKSKKIVNAPATQKMIEAGRKGPKSPKLSEAYEHFTGKPMKDAHRAMADVRATIEVYRHLSPLLADKAA